MFCHQCGTKIREGTTFCSNCGEKVETIVPGGTDPAEKAGQSDQPAVTIEEMKIEQQEQLAEAEEEIRTGSYTAPEAEEKTTSIPAPPIEPLPIPTQMHHSSPRPATPQTIDARELPMTLGGWIGTMLILLIPVVGLIMPFVWAFGSDVNRSKKTFFQAMLLINLVLIVLIIVFSSAIAVFVGSFSDSMFY